MALAERMAALGTRVEESSDVANMRSALFSSVSPNVFKLKSTFMLAVRGQRHLVVKVTIKVLRVEVLKKRVHSKM